MMFSWPSVWRKFEKNKVYLCVEKKACLESSVVASSALWFGGTDSAALSSLSPVHGGRVRGSGRAADIPGVWRTQAADGGDRGPDGRPGALPHHLLHLSRRAAQNTGDLMNSSARLKSFDSVCSLSNYTRLFACLPSHRTWRCRYGYHLRSLNAESQTHVVRSVDTLPLRWLTAFTSTLGVPLLRLIANFHVSSPVSVGGVCLAPLCTVDRC